MEKRLARQPPRLQQEPVTIKGLLGEVIATTSTARVSLLKLPRHGSGSLLFY